LGESGVVRLTDACALRHKGTASLSSNGDPAATVLPYVRFVRGIVAGWVADTPPLAISLPPIKFTWKTSFPSDPQIPWRISPCLGFELHFVYYSYALALRRDARRLAVLSTDSAGDLSTRTRDAVGCLRRAASILRSGATALVPDMKTIPALRKLTDAEKGWATPELAPPFLLLLADTCLGDAHLLLARKAAIGGTSPSVVARLFEAAAAHFDRAAENEKDLPRFASALRQLVAPLLALRTISHSLSDMYMSIADETGGDHANSLARLQRASESLTKLGSKTPTDLRPLVALASTARATAASLNSRVYFCPPPSSPPPAPTPAFLVVPPDDPWEDFEVKPLQVLVEEGSSSSPCSIM
jgi:hypothetical protein